ncbi:MAG TPA: LCP family protein [Acidimicrobiia bacterium]|nr:LCP family protein [Acidimicrobiia bacterium]
MSTLTQPTSSPEPRPEAPPAGHRWWKRALIALLVLSNLAVFGVYWTLRSAQTAFRENVRQAPPEVVPELNVRPTEPMEPLTFLVIGSDSRAGLDSLDNFGRAAGERSDVIMLVKVDPEEGTAQILSLPRDLLVEIPGHGTNRINAAYSYGGAPLMVRTVRAVTGLPIHHYVEVDFVGFQAIVDEVGGVEIDFPYPARDLKSGLEVDAGPNSLNGQTALAYARSRHYQELQDGRWVSVDASDIGRTARQQQLVLAILDALKKPSTLTETGAVVSSFASHLTVDTALLESSLVELAFQMRNISASRIETATLATYVDSYNGMSIVRMDQPAADSMLAAFGSGAPMSVLAAEPLRVQVLNGNGVSGSAGRWSAVLEEKGFEVLGVGDAERTDFAVTTVIVRPEALGQGQAIIDALGFGEIEAGELDSGLDAVIIVGLDADRTLQSS